MYLFIYFLCMMIIINVSNFQMLEYLHRSAEIFIPLLWVNPNRQLRPTQPIAHPPAVGWWKESVKQE